MSYMLLRSEYHHFVLSCLRISSFEIYVAININFLQLNISYLRDGKIKCTLLIVQCISFYIVFTHYLHCYVCPYQF